jgi:hypothetical protein
MALKTGQVFWVWQTTKLGELGTPEFVVLRSGLYGNRSDDVNEPVRIFVGEAVSGINRVPE